MPVTFDDIADASRRIAPFVRRTPLLESAELNERLGARVFVKAECLQVFGSFKARGAYNAIASLEAATRSRGVLAFSSGNHGQAVAGAARTFGVPSVIVMPTDAPRAKLEATRAHGAEIVTYDRLRESREEIGARIASERGLSLIKPFDDTRVIAGQGTAGLEIVDEAGGLDMLLAPTSGGGLISGLAIALHAKSPDARAIAVEPQGHDDLARSLAAGEIGANAPGVRSLCDALLVERVGEITFAIARRERVEAVQASDAAALAAMRLAFRIFHIVLEPSGALALAAALSGAVDVRGKRVAIVASGGNVDPGAYAAALAQSEPDHA